MLYLIWKKITKLWFITINECVQSFTIVLTPTNDSLSGFTYQSDPISEYVTDSAGYLIINIRCYNK